MGLTQKGVGSQERTARDRAHVGTLRRYVEAMGGELRSFALFPDGEAFELAPEPEPPGRKGPNRLPAGPEEEIKMAPSPSEIDKLRMDNAKLKLLLEASNQRLGPALEELAARRARDPGVARCLELAKDRKQATVDEAAMAEGIWREEWLIKK